MSTRIEQGLTTARVPWGLWKSLLVILAATLALQVFSGTVSAQIVTQAQYQAQYQQVAQIDTALQAWYNYISTSNLYSYLYTYPNLGQRYSYDPSYKAQYDTWVYQTQFQGSQYMQQLQAQRVRLIGIMQAEVAAAQAAQNAATQATSATAGSGRVAPSAGGGAQSAAPNPASPSPGTPKEVCPDNHMTLLGKCSDYQRPQP